MIEISKELLSEVLDWNNEQKRCYKEHRAVEKNEISIYFFDADSAGKTGSHWWKRINIYELAHKCKEWAFLQGYELRSGRDIDVKEDLCYFCEYKQERQIDYYNRDYFLAKTEVEAIIKSCEWILENKETK